MQKLFRNNAFFLIPYILFAIAGSIILLTSSKREIHLAINAHYSSVGDVLFYVFTQIGDGIVAAVVGAFLLWRSLWKGLAVVGAMVAASAVAQLLKHTFWSHEPRPKLYFETIGEPIRLLPDFNNYIYDSFPSGHTTQAFALCCSIAFLIPKRLRWLKVVLFGMAFLIGYSRMYLSQHFFRDVYFGALIGTTVSLLVFTLFLRKGWLKTDESLNLTT